MSEQMVGEAIQVGYEMQPPPAPLKFQTDARYASSATLGSEMPFVTRQDLTDFDFNEYAPSLEQEAARPRPPRHGGATPRQNQDQDRHRHQQLLRARGTNLENPVRPAIGPTVARAGRATARWSSS